MNRFHALLGLAKTQANHATEACHSAHHKPVCSSVIRMLHRLGMTGRVEVQPFGAPNLPPSLFITVNKAVVKLSQAAMAMLSREIIAHAAGKYQTEIHGVYWRIEADFETPDDFDLEGDVFGPTTVGYLVEETVELHQRVEAQANNLEQTIQALNADIASGLDVRAKAISQQVLDKTARRRDERRLAERSATTTREVTKAAPSPD